MPGNVKLGSSNEPDPDPTPYLFVSNEQKRHDMTKPYDPKKSVWISDDEGGFHEGLLHSDDGKKAVVMVGHEVIGVALSFWGKNFSTHAVSHACENSVSVKQWIYSSVRSRLDAHWIGSA